MTDKPISIDRRKILTATAALASGAVVGDTLTADNQPLVRVSADPDDIGAISGEALSRVSVYVDGARLKNVITADERTGVYTVGTRKKINRAYKARTLRVTGLHASERLALADRQANRAAQSARYDS